MDKDVKINEAENDRAFGFTYGMCGLFICISLKKDKK